MIKPTNTIQMDVVVTIVVETERHLLNDIIISVLFIGNNKIKHNKRQDKTRQDKTRQENYERS